MTEPSLIETPKQAAELPLCQWVVAANDRKYCLVDTYVGWPQRMWMSPGGMAHTAIANIPYPLRLADLVEDEGVCPHSWGTQECGHCRRCGRVVAEARPAPASEAELEQLRAVLRAVGGGA